MEKNNKKKKKWKMILPVAVVVILVIVFVQKGKGSSEPVQEVETAKAEKGTERSEPTASKEENRTAQALGQISVPHPQKSNLSKER